MVFVSVGYPYPYESSNVYGIVFVNHSSIHITMNEIRGDPYFIPLFHTASHDAGTPWSWLLDLVDF